MKASLFRCEACNSSRVRRSRTDSASDLVHMLLGSYRLRCLDCDHRFWANILLIPQSIYAKCPVCLDLKLTSWDPKHYRVPRWKRFLIKLGAHRYRCQRCRRNFVSFRPHSPAPTLK
jgi:DNA-directed RNA polymerase subunit RPC12/RpoP